MCKTKKRKEYKKRIFDLQNLFYYTTEVFSLEWGEVLNNNEDKQQQRLRRQRDKSLKGPDSKLHMKNSTHRWLQKGVKSTGN